MESIIGYCNDDDNDDDNTEPVIHSLVTEEYLEMLVAISNERFVVNTERKERFRKMLLDLCSDDRNQGKIKGKGKPPSWEDPKARRERKRAEGLLRKKKLLEEAQRGPKSEGNAGSHIIEGDELGGIEDSIGSLSYRP